MTQIRLKDWSDLSEPGRAEAFGLCLGVAERIQTSLAPFVDLCRADARPADGPLRGLPYAAKDMFRSPGRNPTWGLAEPVDGLLDGKKADVLDRLDSAGACCIGFTRMTALAYQPSGVNPLQGAARNPWNPAFATGGSSSGSAVAVASGAAFVALGSDTGGSLRVPAQGCGVSAWKPTRRTVPDGGAMPLSPSLDTIGLLARSVRDIIAAAPVLAPGLPSASDSDPPQRIAVITDALAAREPPVRAACSPALDAVADLAPRLDPGTGDVSVHVLKFVVEEIENPQLEILLADARKIKSDAEIGDSIATDSMPHSAGRIAAQTAKQVVMQRLREAEREIIYEEFAEKEGEVFSVTVQRVDSRQLTVELGRAEAILPTSEQTPSERYRVGSKMKVLLQAVQRSNKRP